MENRYDKATTIRMFLRNAIFNEEDIVDILIGNICMRIPNIEAEYNSDAKKITIRIKKTELKKNKQFIHSTSFYYPAIAQSYIEFFNHPVIFTKFYNSIQELQEEDKKEAIALFNKVRVLENEYSLLIFNSIALLDNILVIYL